MSDRNLEIFNEREIAAIYEENTGNPYVRQKRIAARAFEAHAIAAEKPVELCKFKNQYGWCKLEQGHKGSHTVIFLGADDDFEE